MKPVKRPYLLALVALFTTGIAVLAQQFYQRPRETVTRAARLALLAAGTREGWCNIAGLPLHYYYGGRHGKPLVLVHGLGGSAEDWTLLFPLLSKDFLVYAFDLPGFGKTPLAPEGTNIHTHVLYLKRFLDTLGYSQVILAGNSLGGWIATRFAIEYPERVQQLYLLNSAGLRREGLNAPYAPDRAAARRILTNMWSRPLPVPGFILDAIVASSQRPAYAGFFKTYDPQDELDSVLSQVQTPTTIIWGTQDRVLPIICAYDLHAGIANSRLVLLPKVGHVPQVQAPARVAGILLADARARQQQA